MINTHYCSTKKKAIKLVSCTLWLTSYRDHTTRNNLAIPAVIQRTNRRKLQYVAYLYYILYKWAFRFKIVHLAAHHSYRTPWNSLYLIHQEIKAAVFVIMQEIYLKSIHMYILGPVSTCTTTLAEPWKSIRETSAPQELCMNSWYNFECWTKTIHLAKKGHTPVASTICECIHKTLHQDSTKYCWIFWVIIKHFNSEK